ncbi:MAG: NAD-binding protein, partial [Myxococcota bacterium]|nr:NAD-binding protein [Myxococcota bacterium]
MRKPRQFILIGAGKVGRALLDDIPLNWIVTVVDIDPQALAAVPEDHGGQTILKIQGDATSRLVLEKVGLTPRSQVAILTGTDDVNREIARLIHGHFQVDDLVCLLDTADDLDAIGLNPSQIALRAVASARLAMTHFSQSEHHLITDQLARGEIRVFQVLPGSGAVGRSLGSLKPKRWLVGAIYREEKLLVPHGETIVEAGDRVMLLGEADVVESVARHMHGSEAVFPMQYGSAIGVLGTDEQATKEGEWLEKKTQADALHTLDAKQFNPNRNSAESIARHIAEQEIGLLVLDSRPLGLGVRLGLQRSKRHDLITSGRIPVLIAR